MSDEVKNNKKKSVEEELIRLYTNFESETSANNDSKQNKIEADDDLFDAEDSFDFCEDRSDVSENSIDLKNKSVTDRQRLLFADKYNQFGKETFENSDEKNTDNADVNVGINYKSSGNIREEKSEIEQPEASAKNDSILNGCTESVKQAGEALSADAVSNYDSDYNSNAETGASAKAYDDTGVGAEAEITDFSETKLLLAAEKKSNPAKSDNKRASGRKFNEKLEMKYNKNAVLSEESIRPDIKYNALAKTKKKHFERIIDNYSRSGSSEKLLSDSPYITAGKTPGNIYTDFIIAAVPLLIWAIYLYGFRVILVSLVSVLSCVCFELWFEYLVHRRVTIQNMSAVKEGLFLSLLFPAAVPLWIPVVAAFFGTVVIKELFGGLGKNLFNPSLAGFALVSVIFRESVSAFTVPFSNIPLVGITSEILNGISGVYPLSAVCGGSLPSGSYAEMIIGQRVGSIGEVYAILICAGLIYLIVRRVISWQIPVSFLAVTIFLYFVFPRHILSYRFTITEMLCGMIPLCAVYFAADFSTAPIFKSGKIFFGIGCGVITVIFRYVGIGIYSAVYAVLAMNIAARPIDLYVVPSFSKMFRGGKVLFGRKRISENNK